MKKIYFLTFTFILLFIFSTKVLADRGDLIYEVQNVVLNNDSITLSGYAFIHRTQNYVTVYKRTADGEETGTAIMTGGGQKVAIKISNGAKEKNFYYNCINDNFNFYYQMYTHDNEYSVDKYNDPNRNLCNGEGTKCYYEDMGFNIEISISEILQEFSYGEELTFSIAAYNNDYGWTDFENIRITNLNDYSNYMEMSYSEGIEKTMELTASSAQVQKMYESVKYLYNGNSVYAATGKIYKIFYINDSYYKNGFFKEATNGINKVRIHDEDTYHKFLSSTYSPGKYAVCVDLETGLDKCSGTNEDNYCVSCPTTEDNVELVALYGSWVKLTGNNKLIVTINGHGCAYDPPNNTQLQCNNNRTLESTCDELTVFTTAGAAKVKIEQTGTISSILTPTTTFAGGGFSFGVLYQNNIKWDYVGTEASTDLHALVKPIMENKIKDYTDFINEINITGLRLGNIGFSSLNKKCTASSDGKDYYGDGITVSCVFTFSEPTLHYNGNVTYAESSNNININNKYYTPINYTDNSDMDSYYDYKLEANIVGMNRITPDASTEDSGDEAGRAWTGNWDEDATFENCEINLYPLLIKGGNYNFIYRPIDLNNPFPNNRTPGINWYDWINIEDNKQRLIKTYNGAPNSAEYSATLTNSTVADIKQYNKNSAHDSYLEWNNIDSSDGTSSFVDEYVTRRSGS